MWDFELFIVTPPFILVFGSRRLAPSTVQIVLLISNTCLEGAEIYPVSFRGHMIVGRRIICQADQLSVSHDIIVDP